MLFRSQTQNPKCHIPDQKFRLTLTSISSLQLQINTCQNSGFNSPLSDSLCSTPYCLHVPFQTNKQRKKEIPNKKKNREKLKTLFILYNNRRFKCYPIPSLQQQTIQKAGMHSFPFFFYSITISNCVKLSTNPSLTIHICLSSIFSQFG